MKAQAATLAATLGATLAWASPASAGEDAGPAGATSPTPGRTGVVTLGVQGRRLYGTTTWLGVLRGGLVLRRFDVAVQAGRGQTTSSLVVNDAALSTFVRFEPARGFRLGVSGAVGVLSVERATNDSPLILSYARLGGRAEVDLAHTAFAPLVALDVGVAGPGRELSVVVAGGGRF